MTPIQSNHDPFRHFLGPHSESGIDFQFSGMIDVNFGHPENLLSHRS